MENLIQDFFKSWETEISSYQEVMIYLEDQKASLIDWNIKGFQKISQHTAISISRAHRATNIRNDLMETIFLMKEVDLTKNNLKTMAVAFDNEEDIERSEIMFKCFANTLRRIDRLSAENKDLIKTGLELVGDNLEMIADVIDKDRVYSRVGMVSQRKQSILLNTRV